MYPLSPVKANVAVCAGGVENRMTDALETWYDCISYAFHSFFEDEKESRINGWRRNRRSARSLLPAVRAVDGVFNAGDCGTFYGTFWSGWRLSSRKRRCPKGFSGALWLLLKKTKVITSRDQWCRASIF